MRHGQTAPHQKLDDKVAIADAPHAVLGEGRKAEFAREEFAVDGKGVAGEGTAAEWEDGDARDELAETVEVVFERKGVREQEVGPSDRLSALRGPTNQHVRMHTEG